MSVFLKQSPGIGGLDEITDAEALFLQNLTGLSYSQGDILYHDGSDLVRLAKGSSTEVLTMGATIPGWAASGAGANTKVAIDSVATAGYLGAASNDGVLRTSAPITYADGGDYITLAITQADTTNSGYLTTTDWDTFNNKAAADQTMYIGTTAVAINRGTAALTLAGITLTTPDIGTPSAGTLTNCTFPTLNQNTTGSAATLTTARNIGGVSFNGSANIVPTTIAVTDESADTSCFVGYFTAATGDLLPKTGTNLTFNSSTGVLTATGFAGPLTGNVTGDCSGSSGSCTGESATVATITTLAPDTATTQATQAAITTCSNLTTVGTIGTGVWGATDVAVGHGGTGASDAATAISNLGGLPLAGGTMSGAIQLGETSIKLDATLSADAKWSGITTSGVSGVTTLAIGDLIYLNANDSRWELVDANLSDGYDKQLGIALTAAADGAALEVLVFGKVRSATFPAFTVGSPLYISETAGDMTHTAPTTTDACIRQLGFALTAEDLLFNPSNDYYTHT